MCGRAKNNALYAKGYAQKLTSAFGTDYYLRPVMEAVEREYPYEDIRVIREAVDDRLKRERKRNASGARDSASSSSKKKAPSPSDVASGGKETPAGGGAAEEKMATPKNATDLHRHHCPSTSRIWVPALVKTLRFMIFKNFRLAERVM